MNPSSVWMDRPLYEAAERKYYENVTKATLTPLADEVAKARQRLIEIRDNFDVSQSCETTHSIDTGTVKFFEKKLVEFQNIIYGMQEQLDKVNTRLSSIENFFVKDSGNVSGHAIQVPKAVDKQDDDVDLFASDSDDDANASNVREERLAAYNSKKSKRKTHVIEVPNAKYKQDDDDSDYLYSSDSDDDENPTEITEKRLALYNTKKCEKPAVIAKSNIILDVKPWDDETDMVRMEEEVRKIVMDGLVWGASKLVPLAYGIHKLQVSCVVEDEKVSVDALQETIESIEDYVQSVDIAAFNKV